jgi:glycogen debranching enzyme
MPILLGDKLPTDAADLLAKDLSPDGPFLTEFGLATERPDSPHYHPDGYWRGPAWPPPTWFAFDGLCTIGRTDLAEHVARRFCDTYARAGNAMHENFDVRTGQGLRAPAYSWTAAAFIRLAGWLHRRRSTEPGSC